MPAHFLLTARARTLSLVQIARLGDDEAHGLFREMRWPATNGEPVCPRCDCAACYVYAVRRLFKCKACAHQFTVTSGTIFASRKLPVQTYLLAIAIFVNAVKGVSALQLGRDLDVQYKTAFVLAHKLRETMAANQNGMARGEVEIDGCYIGGSIRQENYKAERRDRRLAENQTGKRRVVVVMRERGGRTLPFVVRSEDEAVSTIRRRVEPGSTVYADEASAWDSLHARYETKRINHSFAFSDAGACTNQAESFFSRLRRAEYGQHHRISGAYLHFYAGEMAWREDMRRVDNGNQLRRVGMGALAFGKSRNWTGYWQRAAA